MAKKSQRVKYWISYRLPDGTQRRESVGAMEDLDGHSIEDARAAMSKRRVQKRENRIMDIKKDNKMSFNELKSWYMKLEKVKNRKAMWLIDLRIGQFCKEFGDFILSTIKKSDIENFQQKLLRQGKAPATVDQIISKAKAMINAAFDDGIVGGDVLRAFKVDNTLRPGSDVRNRILSPGEFEKLMKYSPDHLKPVIACGYYTGMRRTEILSLKWDKVNLNKRMIQLEAKITKTEKIRKIPICSELYRIFVKLPNRLKKYGQDNHVFQYRGKPMKNINKGLKNACESAKIIFGRKKENGFIFHDLRHTFNTNMRKAGVQETVIMEITGHSTRAMFRRYNTIDNKDRRTAVDQLETFLANVDQNVDQSENTKKATNQKPLPNKAL